MYGYYINLDSSTERDRDFQKQLMEQGLEELIFRFSAIDGSRDKIIDEFIDGSWLDLVPTKRAIWLSFEEILKKSIGAKNHVTIFEDDIQIGSLYKGYYEKLNSHKYPENWDLVFLNCILNVNSIRLVGDYFKYLKIAFQNRELLLLDGKSAYKYGNGALIVNKNSVDKLLRVMSIGKTLGIPKDVYLRKLILNNQIRALTLFPFTVALNEHHKNSTIKPLSEKLDDFFSFSNSFFLNSFTDSRDNIKKRAESNYLHIVKSIINQNY